MDCELKRTFGGDSPVAATQELLMEPTLAAGHDDLRGLRLDLLRRATEIYLGLAYPGAVVPEVVKRLTERFGKSWLRLSAVAAPLLLGSGPCSFRNLPFVRRWNGLDIPLSAALPTPRCVTIMPTRSWSISATRWTQPPPRSQR